MRKLLFFAALGALLLALVTFTIGLGADYNPPPGWGHPAPGRSVTAVFGRDNSGVGGETSHSGIDFGTATAPETKILSAGDGQVTLVQQGGLLFQGVTIVIFHGWGSNGNCVSTLYAHNRDPVVQPGQVVSQGQEIATAHGFQPPAGKGAFQWHLHFSFLKACPGGYRYGDFADPNSLPSIVTRWDGQPPLAQADELRQELENVEWQVQGRDLMEVEWDVKDEETEPLQETIEQSKEQANSGSSTNPISLPLVGILLLAFLLGAILLSSGKTWPLGLMLIVAVAVGIFILLSSSEGKGEEISLQPTEVVAIEFPPLRQDANSPASEAEEVIFPDLSSIEEVSRNQPIAAATVNTPGELLPLADLLEIGVSEAAKNNIQNRYSEIVDRSIAAGYNPAFTVSIWIEESGASNYGRYPGVADFGCIRFPREDFDAQLNCFLSLWSKYETTEQFRVCRGEDNKLSLREFLLIYEGGFKSCENNQFLAEPQFPGRLRDYYSKVTGGAKLDF